jgi:uncharacterized protein YndB with AHSA1/START domain
MKKLGDLTISTPSDRELAMTRVFDAPRELVFAAYTKPELIRRWLGVQNGWSMSVCEVDLRVGGAYRYVWSKPSAPDMGMVGIFREIRAPERIVSSERFDDPWYPGEGLATTRLVENAGKTTLTMLVRYDSKEVRDAVIASPMDTGVAASFVKLAEVLASLGG